MSILAMLFACASSPPLCPDGTVADETGGCVAVCPTGFVLDNMGDCMAAGTSPGSADGNGTGNGGGGGGGTTDSTTGGSGTTSTGGPTDGTDDDTDGDGLSNAEENDLGTDPSNPDSDGDGWMDGVEVDDYSDPLSSADHPYQGGWPKGACRYDIAGTGYRVGDVAANFTTWDQNADPWRLHDFCDRVVLLVSSAEWCGPCQHEAPQLQAWFERYEEHGLMVVTLLTEDYYGRTPDQATLQRWQDGFGLEHPVVVDADWAITGQFVTGYSIGIPTMHLLVDGMVVAIADGWVDERIIEDALSGLSP